MYVYRFPFELHNVYNVILENMELLYTCCGADKRVGSTNTLRDYRRACVVTPKGNGRRDRRRDNRYNKSDVFIAGITNVYVNVRGGCMWSSTRMGYVVSWYGRVVDVCSWTFDEGSWRRSSRGDTARCLKLVCWDRSWRWIQLDDRSGKLKSVESLNATGWSLRAAEIGRVVECSWTIVAGSWDRSVGRW